MLHLDPRVEGTLQERIQQIVTAGILTGRFKPGERLPSSRKLAEHLGISRITVTLAYTELVANDYLEARGRSGYFVSLTAPQLPDLRQSEPSADSEIDWNRRIGQHFSGLSTLGRPADWQRFRFPFIYGQTDPALFDHGNWRLCAIRALGVKDFDALTADHYERDDPMLIDRIVSQILPRRGIAARPEEVLLTMGAQNALWITAQVLLTQRRKAAVEAPCYPGLRDILDQTRCHMVQVPVDGEGLPPDLLQGDEDAVFITPSHQAPTGSTMPTERRRALLERAGRDDFLVVEDDYDFEMSFWRSPSPALKSLDAEGRVIYIGSFSKSIFPGLRLGYLVAPEPFIREARALRALVLRHPPGHIQRTTAYFLSLGYYDAQLNRMSRAFKRRRLEMEEAIGREGLTIAGHGAQGGSSFWLRAPQGVDTRELAHTLRARSVLIEPGSAFFNGEAPDHQHFRLSYSSIRSKMISEGIAEIGAALS
ncbi:MAG: PLP-dependent aminotransferase family protein [Pseudomonadota bacterium]